MSQAPCPFCGSTKLIAEFIPNTGGNRKFIRCLACHAKGPWSTLAINEVDGWNQRALAAKDRHPVCQTDGCKLLIKRHEGPSNDVYLRGVDFTDGWA